MAFTEAGLVLGATVVAPMRRGGGDVAKLDLSGEDRILALLAAAFSASVNAAVLVKLRHASELWAQGDKCLAQIHLEHLRLPKLESEEQAFRLFLTDNLIAAGQSPRDLCKALGFDLPEGLKKYNPNQPRVPAGNGRASGQFGSTGSSSAGGGSSPSHADAPSGAEAAAAATAEGTILGPLIPTALTVDVCPISCTD